MVFRVFRAFDAIGIWNVPRRVVRRVLSDQRCGTSRGKADKWHLDNRVMTGPVIGTGICCFGFRHDRKLLSALAEKSKSETLVPHSDGIEKYPVIPTRPCRWIRPSKPHGYAGPSLAPPSCHGTGPPPALPAKPRCLPATASCAVPRPCLRLLCQEALPSPGRAQAPSLAAPRRAVPRRAILTAPRPAPAPATPSSPRLPRLAMPARLAQAVQAPPRLPRTSRQARPGSAVPGPRSPSSPSPGPRAGRAAFHLARIEICSRDGGTG